MRFTLEELCALLDAGTEAEAGELEGDQWTEKRIKALTTAVDKLRVETARREERRPGWALPQNKLLRKDTA